VHPQALAPVNPLFPDKAANDNPSGEVTVLLFIDETGKVRDLAVVDAKPEGYFEESSLNAFRNTRWAPAQKDGRIVKSRVLIRVRYELGKDGGKVGF
jgi:protein TonB